ncbi:alpha-D-ribose 1-methylphosphonate 5-triphosphate diphosphatase [Spirosoma arcticum]
MLLVNARIVLPERILENGCVHIENGQIAELGETTALYPTDSQVIDAGGQWLMPGLIDMHTDAMDTEISPRRRADFPIDIAFRELERRMSGCGITTVYHSLHLGYAVAENNSDSKYTRREIFEQVHALSQQPTLINNRIHLRFELTGVYAYETALDLITNGLVGLLSVMDHTPGQGQTSVANFLKYMARNGLSDAEAQQKLTEMQATPRLSEEQFARLVSLAQANGIPVASHDDDTAQKVDEMYAAGIRICEFPVSMEAARRGKELGMSVIGGAANVLRGGSLSGNLGIEAGIRAGAIDSLCSDYYPPAMLHSVFQLATGDIALPEAVNLATRNVAQAVGIADRTGSIEPGKQADLILVNTSNGVPLVTHTFVNGNLSARASMQLVPNPTQSELV